MRRGRSLERRQCPRSFEEILVDCRDLEHLLDAYLDREPEHDIRAVRSVHSREFSWEIRSLRSQKLGKRRALAKRTA
jgi:hypothetical protein